MYAQQRNNSLLWYEPDEAYWRFNIDYWLDPANDIQNAPALGVKGRYFLIEDSENQVAGSVWIWTRRWGRALRATPELSTAPTVNRSAVMTSLLRLLRDLGHKRLP